MSGSPVGIIQWFDPPATGERIHLLDGQDATIGAVDTAEQTCELHTRCGSVTQTVRHELLERGQQG